MVNTLHGKEILFSHWCELQSPKFKLDIKQSILSFWRSKWCSAQAGCSTFFMWVEEDGAGSRRKHLLSRGTGGPSSGLGSPSRTGIWGKPLALASHAEWAHQVCGHQSSAFTPRKRQNPISNMHKVLPKMNTHRSDYRNYFSNVRRCH